MSPTACNPLPLAEMQRVVPGTQYSMWNINQMILEDKQCKLKIIWKQQENSFLFSLFLKTVSNVALFSRTKFYLELTYEKQIVHFIFNEGCYTLTIYNTKVQNLGRPRTRPSPYYLTELIYHPSKLCVLVDTHGRCCDRYLHNLQTLRLGRFLSSRYLWYNGWSSYWTARLCLNFGRVAANAGIWACVKAQKENLLCLPWY